MNCYLKISYLSKHRKYRYLKDKPINFQQIRRELQVTLPLDSFIYSIQHLNPNSFEKNVNQQYYDQQKLVEYLKKKVWISGETIKIKIIEYDISKIKKSQNFYEENGGQIMIPGLGDRQRSKSEEIMAQTVNILIPTDSIDFTHEFLCNSNIQMIDYGKKEENIDWIQKQIQKNKYNRQVLQVKKRLTDIQGIYKRLEQKSKRQTYEDNIFS